MADQLPPQTTPFETAPDETKSDAPKYVVELPTWNGPYDLLLQVIDEQELDLLNLDISKLLEHYLTYFDALQIVDIDEASEFLVVGATLAQIKSKLLLPKEENENEEEEKDPRADLVRYLQEYQKIKVAAEQLKERPLLGRDVFLKGVREVFQGVEGEGHGNLFQLVRGFQKVMRELKAEVPMAFERETVAVSDRFHEIFHLLKENGESTFSDLLAERRRSKIYLICTFLALLELVRLKKVTIHAGETEESIILRIKPGAEDDYSHSEFDQAPANIENNEEPAVGAERA